MPHSFTVERLQVPSDLSMNSLKEAVRQASESGMTPLFLLTSPENYFIGKELFYPELRVCKSRMLIRSGWMLVCDSGVVLSENW